MSVLRLVYEAPFMHDNRDVARGMLPPGFVALSWLKLVGCCGHTNERPSCAGIANHTTSVVFQIGEFDLLGYF